VLTVKVQNYAPETISVNAGKVNFLRLELEAFGTDINVDGFTLLRTGTARDEDTLNIDVLHELKSLPSTDNYFNAGLVSMTFREPLIVQKDADIAVELIVTISIPSSATMGRTISAELYDISIQDGLISRSPYYESIDKSYIGAVSSGIVIDGGFADWNSVKDPFSVNDRLNDMTSSLSRPNVDLSQCKLMLDSNSLSFYFSVEGIAFGGTFVPSKSLFKQPSVLLPDDDGDGVPNVRDPNPYSNIDSDGDKLPDDYETVFTHTNPNLPDSDGDTYLDNIDVEPNNPRIQTIFQVVGVEEGKDTAYIFIDSDKNLITGYNIGPTLNNEYIGADYMIKIAGKYGYVFEKKIYQYQGPGWNWGAPISDVPVGKDKNRFETQINLSLVGLENSDGFNIFFKIHNWNNDSIDICDNQLSIDKPTPRSNDITGRSGTRASTFERKVTGTGANNNDQYGWNVSYAGDINKDGYSDIIIGAPYDDGYGDSITDCGAVYLFLGDDLAMYQNYDAADADLVIYGKAANDHFGWSLSFAGDFNSDTNDDIIVGAPDNDDSATDAGIAYIFDGDDLTTEISTGDGIINLSSDSNMVKLTGAIAGDRFGFSVSNAGDFDNDNDDDVVVGAPLNDSFHSAISNAGMAYLFYGSSSPSATTNANNADCFFPGNQQDETMGFSVSNASDINNDGYDDIMVGAPGNNSKGNDAGAVKIFFGGNNWPKGGVVKERPPNYRDIFNDDTSETGIADIQTDNDVYYTIPKGGKTMYVYAISSQNVIGNIISADVYVQYKTDSGYTTADAFECFSDNDTGSTTQLFTFSDTSDAETTVGPFDVTNYVTTPSDLGLLGFQASDNDNQDAIHIDYIWLYVKYSPPPPDANVSLFGNESGQKFGYSISTAGDLNDDGRIDLIIGSPGAGNSKGNASIYFGGDSINNPILFSDDFEADNLNQWTTSGNWETSSADAHAGIYSARVYSIHASGNMEVTNAIDVSKYSDVKLSFWWSNQTVFGNVSLEIYDGSWRFVTDTTSYSSTWEEVEIDIDANFNLVSNFKFRFKGTDIVGFGYEIFIDDVILEFSLTSNVTLVGETAGDQFGYSVSELGDINNDGIDDVVVGAPYHTDSGKTNCGGIYVFKGSTSMAGLIQASGADYIEYGDNANERLGHSVGAARRIDNTAFYAVLAGAPGATPTNANIGKAYVFSMVPEYQLIIIPVFILFLSVYFSRKTRRSSMKNK
jgi:hypothetical protein